MFCLFDPLVVIILGFIDFIQGDVPSIYWLSTLKLMILMFFEQAKLANHGMILTTKEYWFFCRVNRAESISHQILLLILPGLQKVDKKVVLCNMLDRVKFTVYLIERTLNSVLNTVEHGFDAFEAQWMTTCQDHRMPLLQIVVFHADRTLH